MKNLIPQFISKNFTNNRFNGEFEAVAVFLDISGFTNMTEKLVKSSKNGVETLSEILNKTFDFVITEIYKRNGFVSSFAGDSFTIIFPEQHLIDAIFSMVKIAGLFLENKTHHTKLGSFDVSAKIGMSFGNVNWGIVGSGDKMTYFFKGNAISNCVKAQEYCKSGEIIIDDNLLKMLPVNEFKAAPIKENFHILKSIKFLEPTVTYNYTGSNIGLETINKFFPKEVIDYSNQFGVFESTGEFRDIVAVFVSFIEPEDFYGINDVIGTIIEKANIYGGYFENLIFGDKGSYCLIDFGIPTSYENIIERSINFVDKLRNVLGKSIRIGMTFGKVFAGIMGNFKRIYYGVLGDSVNLASRFMSNAKWGDIWICETIFKKINNDYLTQKIGDMNFKGKSGLIPVYQLLDKKETISNIYTNKFIGRNEELEELSEKIKSTEKTFGGCIIYLYGDSGTGKSRLAYELKGLFNKSFNSYTIQAENILKTSFNSFIYLLKNIFEQFNAKTDNEKKIKFENSFKGLIANLKESKDARKKHIIPELERTKSFLASLLDIYWEDSIYAKLSPKERYENTMHSLKELIKALSLIKPSIFILEDIHLMDKDSRDAINLIIKNINYYPFVLIATSRYNDYGELSKFNIESNIPQFEVKITNFSKPIIKEFITNYFGMEVDEYLLDFIEKKTQGNPFFMEQFCLYLKEKNLLMVNNNIICPKDKNIYIPSDITSIMISRIDRLSKEMREMLEISSVSGREFDIVIIKEVIEKIDKILDAYFNSKEENDITNRLLNSNNIDTYIKTGLRENLWTALSRIKYVFSSNLLRDVAYEMQLKSKLKKLHRFTAEALEKIYDNNQSYYMDIAYHYEKGEIQDKAIEYMKKAIEYSEEHYNNENAIELYNKLFDYTQDEKEKINILIKESKIFETIGKWDETEKALLNALDMTTVINDKIEMSEILIELAKLYRLKSDYENCEKMVNKAQKLSEELSYDYITASSLNLRGLIFWDKGEYSDSLKCYNKSIEIFSKTNDKKNISANLANIGLLYLNQGNYDNALAYLTKALEIYEEINYKKGIADCSNNIGIIYYNNVKPDEALEYYNKSLEIRKEIGNREGISENLSNIGLIYYEKGEYDTSLEYFQQSLMIDEDLGNKSGISIGLNNFGLIYYNKGIYDKATYYYFRAIRMFRDINFKIGISCTLSNIGNVYKKLSKYELAERYYNKSIKFCEELHLKNELCENYFYKAEIFYDIGSYQESKYYNELSFDLSRELKLNNLYYKNLLLKSKLEYFNNKVQGLKMIEDMLAKYNDDEEKLAEINFELFKITNDKTFKFKSGDLYFKLFKKMPKAEYKENIEILMNETPILH